MEIVNCPDEEKKVKQFNTYIRQEENLKKFQRIFPIIATTSISAHKIGEPGTYFDMVIMDEASQGNIAMSSRDKRTLFPFGCVQSKTTWA